MSVRILTGDVRDMLATLADESVHCVVTSPPYWGLRDYGVEGQIGMEPTMGEHIDTMVDVFREVRRVLRKDGTVWLNDGSSYVSGDISANQSRQSGRVPAYGSDGKAPEDSQGIDCVYLDPCDEHQADSLNRRAGISRNGQQIEQSPPLAGPTDRDSEHSGSSGASLGASPQSAPASNTPASSRHVLDASDPSATASASRKDDPTSSGDARPSAHTAADKIDIAEIQRLLVVHNWDKEPLALACLYLSIASRKWKAKDLANVPNLIAEALQCDGWWVRSEIIWAKPNPMPESVTDRPASSHEKIWLLTRSARYFYDAEAVRRPMTPGSIDRLSQDIDGQKGSDQAHAGGKTNGPMKAVGWRDGGARWTNEDQYQNKTEAGTANLRNVWTIPTKGFSGAHYATFPPDLIVPCIKAGTSEKGCCAECGAPWVRVIESTGVDYKSQEKLSGTKADFARIQRLNGKDYEHSRRATNQWSPSCDCAAATIPCTVLDPFIGSGTTAMVADRLGRDCIGIDLNPANVEMARERIQGDAGMFADVAAP